MSAADGGRQLDQMGESSASGLVAPFGEGCSMAGSRPCGSVEMGGGVPIDDQWRRAPQRSGLRMDGRGAPGQSSDASARFLEDQMWLAELRDQRSVWAADLLANEELAVLEVELFPSPSQGRVAWSVLVPPHASAASPSPAALRVVALDRDETVLLDQVSRVVMDIDAASTVNEALSGRTTLIWDADGFDWLACAMCAAGAPYQGRHPTLLALAAAEWCVGLDQLPGRCRTPQPPLRTARRAAHLLMLLRQMAAGDVARTAR